MEIFQQRPIDVEVHNLNNRVVKNASWIIGCKVAQSIVNLIISMITARYLGPSNYGLIGYASSIVAFVLPIMQLGLSKTLVQELIERPESEGMVLGTALTMNVVSSVFCIIGVYIFLSCANAGETETIFVGALYSLSLLFQATEIIQYWFQAKLLSKYPSIATLISYVVVAVYKVYLLVTRKDVAWFAVANAIDFFFVSIILIVIYDRMGNQKLIFSKRLALKLLNRSRYYIGSCLMVSVFQQTDRIMLKLLIDETATGYYSAAITCVSVTGFVFAAIIDSMRPTILQEHHRGNPQYKTRLIQLFSIITYLSLAQSIMMTALAKEMVLVLFGEQYLPSVSALRIAVWYVTFSYFGTIRNIWILAENKQQYLWIINLSGAVLNVVLNALLIPSFGVNGAAVASLITQFFANVIISYILPQIRYSNTLMIASLNPKRLIEFLKECSIKGNS